MSERQAVFEWLGRRVDFLTGIGGVVSLIGFLWIGIKTGSIGPELVEDLFTWPAAHTQALFTAGLIVLALGVLYRLLTLDLEAEHMAANAVFAQNNPRLTDENRMHSAFTVEVANVVKSRLGTPVRNAANELAVRGEARRYVDQQTRDGMPQSGMRISHALEHIQAAVELVFEPSDFELQLQRRSRSYRMRARRNILHREPQDFLGVLALGLRLALSQVLPSGTRSNANGNSTVEQLIVLEPEIETAESSDEDIGPDEFFGPDPMIPQTATTA